MHSCNVSFPGYRIRMYNKIFLNCLKINLKYVLKLIAKASLQDYINDKDV